MSCIAIVTFRSSTSLRNVVRTFYCGLESLCVLFVPWSLDVSIIVVFVLHLALQVLFVPIVPPLDRGGVTPGSQRDAGRCKGVASLNSTCDVKVWNASIGRGLVKISAIFFSLGICANQTMLPAIASRTRW
jgi:hypothetical protein